MTSKADSGVSATLRIGEGYDVHALEEGRPMILGCRELESDRGPVGHSDGDALAHAICDALLGAAALGDIGRHFPPGDARYKGAPSSLFLERAVSLVAEAGYGLVNVDSTVILEKPRLSPHIVSIRESLSEALGCEVDRVSVKAKTAEKMGPVGEGRAIEARAIALIVRI
jgi:2-C-methyl-D-erythritol 2,4-cyclodiphosphate synthase